MMKHTMNGKQIDINLIIQLIKNASIDDLLELRWKITEIINKIKGGKVKYDK